MKKICIVQGGRFLLGIDQENIIAQRTWAETAAQTKQDERTVHLEALLSRQTAQAVSDHAVCLELWNNGESLFLVADRLVADKVEISDAPAPLPSFCPALTAKLCPQVVIWEELPILLLDLPQIFPVAAELGQNIGVVQPEEHSAPQETTDQAARQEARKKEAAAIDEAILKPVVSWTIARFKQQCGKGKHENLRLTMEQLPSELIEMIKGRGLNKKVIEYLMEQIVLRCKASMCCKKKGGRSNAG